MRSFLRGVWSALDGLRRFLHLLLLLTIFGFLIGILRGSVPRVPSRAALLIAPQGQLVEQLSGDPVTRAIAQARGQNRGETLLWDLVDDLRAAAHDDRIRVVVLDLDKLEASAGLPTMQELAAAIHEFRRSGKKVIAFASAYSRDQYFLASQADEIYMDPLGYVLIDGYGRYRMYYKDVLDKLNVSVNVFRVGQYKSAVETYTRDDMSEQDRLESTQYLGALWTNYQQGITSSRGLKNDAVTQYVDTLAQQTLAAHGATAEVALKSGLVTALKSRQQLEKYLIGLVGEDDSNGSFRAVMDQDYTRVVHATTALGRADRARIGVIVAEGEILDGTQPAGSIGGDSLSKLIRQARMDDRIKAVVLRVDSPGGSVTASDEIYRELLALEATGKPLVISMSNLAASGGYYISAPGQEIWASAATITGSIGIFAVIPTFERTLQKIGVGVDGVGTAPLAGQTQLVKPLNSDARTLLQAFVEHGYDEFLARVSAGRHMSTDAVNTIGQGRVWAGSDAARNGLVDHLGSFDDAVRAAARRAKVSEYKLQFIAPELSWTQQLVLQMQAWGVRVLWPAGEGEVAAVLAKPLDPLLREVQRLERFTERHRLYAYCFCQAQ